MRVLGIDIGGSAIKYSIVNDLGDVLYKSSKINERIDLERFKETLFEIIDGMLSEYKVAGIALSVPAATNSKSGEVLSEGSMPFLLGISLQDLLKEKYLLPVSSENDGNCAALAEVWKGAGEGCSDALSVVIGTGVGGAVVKNGKIHAGTNFFSGEFGYLIMNFDFEKSLFNTWSDMGATWAMTEKVKEQTGKTCNGIEVFEMANEGNEVAMREIDHFYKSNAVGIFNLQYTYDPEVIILGGAISSRIDFKDELEKRLDVIYKSAYHAPVRPEIRIASYGNDANMVGAVYYFLQLQNK